MEREEMNTYRHFLKTSRWDEWKNDQTGQKTKAPPPAIQKPYGEKETLIPLVASEELRCGNIPLLKAIGQRKSHRKFTPEPLTLEELSFLLWSTQGIRKIDAEKTTTLRTVPSGGARHPFETYLAISRVEGVHAGLYRYLPVEHSLLFMQRDDDLKNKIVAACLDQKFVGEAAVVFIWTAIPERSEWKYSIVSHKMIALDAGHVCQNLYLSATAIDAGTCAIGAYRNDQIDAVLKVDGKDEFVIYIAPVGKIA